MSVTVMERGKPMSGQMNMDIQALLHGAADREASDVHLVPGYPATYRVHGRLETVGNGALEA